MTKITMTANKGQPHVRRAVYDATRLFFLDQGDAGAQYLIGYIYITKVEAWIKTVQRL